MATRRVLQGTLANTTDITNKAYVDAVSGAQTLLVASSEANIKTKRNAHLVCDGTADEAEINTALAASTGGVLLSGGRFNIATPITLLNSGDSLMGIGKFVDQTSDGNTIGYGTGIVLSSGFTGVAGILVHGGSTAGMLANATVAHLAVNGASHGTTADGIRFSSFGGTLFDVGAVSCTGDGIAIRGYTSGTEGANWSTYDSIVFGVVSSYNAGAGISVLHNAADLHIADVVCHNNLHGVHIDSASPQLTDFHCYANTQHGVWLDGGGPSRSKLVNGKIEHSGRHGLFCDGTGGSGQDGVQIIGVGFNCNSELNDGIYAHLSTDGPGGFTNGLIMGCQFGNSDGATNLPWAPLFVSSNVAYLNCVGNNFGSGGLGGAHAAPYIDSASLTTSRISSNIGLADQGVGTPSPTTLSVSTKTGAYTVLTTDDVILANTTSSFTVTLPTAVGATKMYRIKKTNASNTLTIGSTSGTIDGSASITVTQQYTSLDFVSDGTNWNIV